MNEITVSAKDLYETAKAMLDDGMDTVTVSIMEADGEGDDALPACLHFEASRDSAPEMGIDYEEIDAIE